MSILRHIFVVFLALVAWQYYDKNFNKPSVKPRFAGYFHPTFRKVAETFRSNVESGLEKGAAFAVYHNGELLVDLWGGWADMAAERHWQENTLCMTWSVVKAAAAIAVARLVDMGHLDYKQKVVHYWPEFGSNNKENITVEGLLSHTAGLLTLDESLNLLEYKYDWLKIEKSLALQSPKWPPGTAVGYHGCTYGMYADALVRKTDPQHRNLSQFFQDEIASALASISQPLPSSPSPAPDPPMQILSESTEPESDLSVVTVPVPVGSVGGIANRLKPETTLKSETMWALKVVVSHICFQGHVP
ncbi:beta-lactamase-related domain containing protein [Elysia marginata]|uniref:Beta-lactamase-related domain containing protein n=1 Tax=Elysia marginata TaxID=1093978 RepID=A0AAV4IKP7_9GAST|nr:beta-lactamase-related domain containing protein [Elysia marginata]